MELPSSVSPAGIATPTLLTPEQFANARVPPSSPPRETPTLLAAAQAAQARVPQAVTDAIHAFVAPPGLKVMLRQSGETSPIFSWGVRVVTLETPPRAMWICMASASCRAEAELRMLSSGKTSKAMAHLKQRHSHLGISRLSVSNGAQSTTGAGHKRARLTLEMTGLRHSELFQSTPRRLYLLLEVLRIVNHHLPLRLGEFDESSLIRDLTIKEEMRTAIDERVITQAVVELFAATRGEIKSIVKESRLPSVRSFSVVVDWRTDARAARYLVFRLFFVDVTFTFRSVLLGVRHVQLKHGEDAAATREVVHKWMLDVLKDFGISQQVLFAATGNASSDAKRVTTEMLELPWVWCIPDLTKSAMRAACGLVGDPSKSENKAVTGLIHRMIETVHQTKDASLLGTLILDLGAILDQGRAPSPGAGSDGLSNVVQRSVSLTTLIERILNKWDALVIWYDERPDEADGVESFCRPAFPLVHDHVTLQQLLSLLQPIAKLSQRSRLDQPAQVEVFITLLALRRSVLNTAAALKHYRSTRERPQYMAPADLVNTVAATRLQLRKEFDRAFFNQYTERELLHKSSLVHELQMLLHPKFKRSLDTGFKEVVLMCNIDAGHAVETAVRNFNTIKDRIQDKLDELMGASPPPPAPAPLVLQGQHIYSEDIDDMVSMSVLPNATDDHVAKALQDLQSSSHQSRSTELLSWLNEVSELAVDLAGNPEELLTFWCRQSGTRRHAGLCKAARVLFSVPASGAQLERDVAAAERTVRAQQSKIDPCYVDMCSFLHCNPDFVDLSQCSVIDPYQLRRNVPSNMVSPLEAGPQRDVDDLVAAFLAQSHV